MVCLLILMFVLLCVFIGVFVICQKDYKGTRKIREERLITTTPSPNAISQWVKYPVPLDDDIQKYIYNYSKERCVPSYIVMAIIGVESNFDTMMRGDNGNSYGLMQIYQLYHLDRMERLGVVNLFDEKQNIRVGVDVLAELMEYGRSIEWVLMAYNGGINYACAMEDVGKVSQYAHDVITMSECFLERAMVMSE